MTCGGLSILTNDSTVSITYSVTMFLMHLAPFLFCIPLAPAAGESSPGDPTAGHLGRSSSHAFVYESFDKHPLQTDDVQLLVDQTVSAFLLSSSTPASLFRDVEARQNMLLFHRVCFA